MKSLEIAAISMQRDGHQLTQLAHNMANVQTPGYRRSAGIQPAMSADFASLVQQQLDVQAAPLHRDETPGKLEATGRPLDVALSADEYLALKLSDGRLALTRYGRLQADASGVLTAAGQVVQGLQGDIRVPPSTEQLRIDAQGQVWGDEKMLGQIAVVRPGKNAALTPLGNHVLTLEELGAGLLSKPTQVTPQHLEGSNVQTGREMMALMLTMRHAESMTRVIQGSDELLGRLIQKFGEV